MAEEKKDWSKLELGALWKKEGKNGAFYSGKLKIDGKEQEIVCFANKNKSSDNQPDIHIYKSEPRQ
jgi:hypothetical protein